MLKRNISIFIAALLAAGCVCLYASGTAETSEQGTIIEKTTEIKQEIPEENVKIDEYKKSFFEAFDEGFYDNAVSIWKESSEYVWSLSEPNMYVVSVIDGMSRSLINYYKSYSFSKISVPSVPLTGKAFKSAFQVKVTYGEENKPAANKEVLVTYPALNSDGSKGYATTTLPVTSDGTVSFSAPVPSFACSDVVTFSVNVPEGLFEDADAVPSFSVPYKVMTNMRGSGGSIAIVDYNKNDKVITTNSESSSAVLTALMNKGFTNIGNCDFTTAVASGSDAQVQKEASDLFQKSVTYLIYGTVKYKTVEKTDSGYHVVLNCAIKVRNVIKNKVLLSTVVVTEATEKTEWAATNSARKKFASEVAEQITYGM